MSEAALLWILGGITALGGGAWMVNFARISNLGKRANNHDVLIGQMRTTLEGLGPVVQVAVDTALRAHEGREESSLNNLRDQVSRLTTEVAVLNKVIGNGTKRA